MQKFLGMIHESENDADGILKILKSMHSYVPFCEIGGEKEFGEQGVVGDQLSVERGVNGLMSLANGFTSEDRLEGLHMEIVDWHAGNKFLEVAFSNLYNVSSAADKCTMFSDRNLINRRNVKDDVSAAANACRRFFQIEVEARVIAATMKVLGMSAVEDENPSKHEFPSSLPDATKQEKRLYLNNIATCVVDSFVIDEDRNTSIQELVNNLESEEKEQPDGSGRYHCRYPGCDKTFAHKGKVRRDHEGKHNPPVKIASKEEQKAKKDEDNRDDMLAYQRALLDYGMLLINFWDAILEGDGERVMRCWKFFLMYLKHQGASATKYSLEGLYLMFQVHALLSPQASHHLIWNRFIKNKPGIGGHIPLDLQLEFYNKCVKEAIKKLGPNASQKSLDRICHSMGITTDLMKNFDTNLSVFRRSGRHIQKSVKGDLGKVVKELVSHNAFTLTPGRKYRFYAGMKSSILAGFDVHKMFSWINVHKKHMIIHRKAR